jgi:hypothetical protein
MLKFHAEGSGYIDFVILQRSIERAAPITGCTVESRRCFEIGQPVAVLAARKRGAAKARGEGFAIGVTAMVISSPALPIARE